MPAKKHPFVVMLLTPLCILLALTTSVRSPAQEQDDARRQRPELIEFDAPGAGTISSPVCAPNCGTYAIGMNDEGAITGSYTDAEIVPHGFLRAPNGHIISFDAPGAGLGAGLDEGTSPFSINDLGLITGQFQDPSYLIHGFVRYPDGSFATFDAPGAVSSPVCAPFCGTWGEAINLWGEIAGYYIDANNVDHGFVRSPDGSITTFDAPGAGTGANQGTVVGEKGINRRGEVDGWYIDENNVFHGFLRAPDGTIASVDPLGSYGTILGGINAAGEIAGYYYDANYVGHGFLRAPDGTFTTFDAPGAGAEHNQFQGTLAFSVNTARMVTGIYVDAANVLHGFLRGPDGTFTTIDAPDAGTGANQGTRPEIVNQAGMIAGFYFDAGNVIHGFLRIP